MHKAMIFRLGVPTEIEVDPNTKKFDKYYNSDMIKCKCATCNECWIFINKDGSVKDQCYYGGPYTSYVEV
jgi:hypothetical protein